MSDLQELNEHTEDHPDVSDLDSWSIFTPSSTDVVVTIAFPHSALPLVAEYLDRSSPPTEEGEGYVAEIRFAHNASLIRFVSQHAGLVRVLAPRSAVDTVTQWARGALKRLETT